MDPAIAGLTLELAGHEKRQIQSHHEVHEDSEVKPGSAGRLTGFRDFAFGDQRLAVGSRPAGRRWE